MKNALIIQDGDLIAAAAGPVDVFQEVVDITVSRVVHRAKVRVSRETEPDAVKVAITAAMTSAIAEVTTRPRPAP